MGFDLCFDVTGTHEKIPDEFDFRYSGRREFFDLMPAETFINLCCTSPYCGCEASARPKSKENFELWRNLVKSNIMRNQNIFLDMINFLEKNPNVYLSCSF